MNRKRKGIRFEWQVKNEYEDDGWVVIRQSASRFPDLVALKPDRILFIECCCNKYEVKKKKLALRRWMKKNNFQKPLFQGKVEVKGG